MKLDFKIQSEELNLAKLIDEEMNKKPKKVYMFMGTLKESGFDILEESIIDTKAKITIFMGVDKKNTTKGLLDNILKYTKDVYVYNNNDLKEFESNIYIFEFERSAIVYLSPSKSTESGLVDAISIFSRVQYNLNDEEDKKDYKNNVKMLLELKKFEFIKLDESVIQNLIQDKVIFSNKQYEHSVRSISEFLGKKDTKKIKEASKKDDETVKEDIFAKDLNIPVVDLSNSDIDIDLSDVVENEVIQIESKIDEDKVSEKKTESKVKNIEKEETKQDNYEELDEEDKELFNGPIDLNSMLLTKSNFKLSNSKNEETKKNDQEDETIIFKKLDLNNISNYMFELPGKQQNGQDLDVLKIPNYIKELIPNFFEFSDKAKTKVISGSQYKVKDIQVDIVDVKKGTKVNDKNAKMMQKKGQTYMTIMSKYLENIDYEENDIARIIKLSSTVYHVEIVSKDMQEYKIWSKIMNKKLKGVDRKYGIM